MAGVVNAESYYNLLLAHPDAVVIDGEDAQRIWQMFQSHPLSPERAERLNSRAFLQAVLMAAIDGSYAMGFVEDIFKSAFMKPVFDGKSFKKVVKSLGQAVLQRYWTTNGGRDLSKVQIYSTTVDALRWSLRPYFLEVEGKMGDE